MHNINIKYYYYYYYYILTAWSEVELEVLLEVRLGVT